MSSRGGTCNLSLGSPDHGLLTEAPGQPGTGRGGGGHSQASGRVSPFALCTVMVCSAPSLLPGAVAGLLPTTPIPFLPVVTAWLFFESHTLDDLKPMCQRAFAPDAGAQMSSDHLGFPTSLSPLSEPTVGRPLAHQDKCCHSDSWV